VNHSAAYPRACSLAPSDAEAALVASLSAPLSDEDAQRLRIFLRTEIANETNRLWAQIRWMDEMVDVLSRKLAAQSKPDAKAP
jgi:hypothetical protein